jgi:hypothetical protein
MMPYVAFNETNGFFYVAIKSRGQLHLQKLTEEELKELLDKLKMFIIFHEAKST